MKFSKISHFFALMGLVSSEDGELDSFSFHKFSGPVSGEARRIIVPNTNHNQQESQSVDFIARPDYSFTYGVHDGESENSQTHRESRNGDEVHGEYRVLQPDGLVRIVRYTADPSTGFKATVEYAPL
uniref:Cuticular protein 86 n=1 Tax=Leptinotarsa decemlineata TaxID=7539 RepID=A0A3Q8HIH7_LEPDE|nr:cuticular protein 86 [Leptinotarsa decemlineata]